MIKRIFSLFLVLVLLSGSYTCVLAALLYPKFIAISDTRKYDTGLNISTDGSNIPKSDISKDQNSGYRFFNFWKATCQHVAHDEWVMYIIDEEHPEGWVDYNNTIHYSWYAGDPDLWDPEEHHSWRTDPSLKSKTEIEAMGEGAYIYPNQKDPTSKEDGYRWQIASACTYRSGWWGFGDPCGEPGYKKIIIKYEQPPDDPEPPDDNNPPTVKLYAPKVVKAGEDFSVTASASDPDGDKLNYIWETVNAVGKPSGMWGSLWYPIEYANTTQRVTVIVQDGQYDAWDSADIDVTEPTVEANIGVTGSLKENRKVVLSDISNCPRHYPITQRTWTVEPVSTFGGITAEDIKHTGDWASETKDVLFKKEGRYKVTLSVVNAAGYSDVAIKFITIAPDEAPVGEITAPTTVYRDSEDVGHAAINLTDKSYSNDDDFIAQKIWKYRYDSDNDGQFYDEHWIALDSANLETYTFKTKDVGKYQLQVDVKEGFGQETMLEYITDSDYRKSSSEIITVEVANLSPTINFELTKKKMADFYFNVANSKYSLNQVTSLVNTHLIPTLNANSYDYKIDVVNNYDYTKTDMSGIFREHAEKHFVSITDKIDLRPQIPIGPTNIQLYDNINSEASRKVNFTTVNLKEYSRNEWISDMGSYYQLPSSIVTAGTSGATGSVSLYAEDSKGSKVSILDVISYRNNEIIRIKDRQVFSNYHPDIYWNAYIDTYIHDIKINGSTLTITISARSSWLIPDPKGGSHRTEYRNMSKSTWSCDLSALNLNNDVNLILSYGASRNSYGEDGRAAINVKGGFTKFKNNNELVSKFTNGDYEVLSLFLNNDIEFIGFGNDTDKYLFDAFIQGINGNGFYKDNTDLEGAVSALAAHMVKPDGYYDIADYVVLNEPIETNIIYEDAENDPMIEKRYKYTHTDPDYFDNSLGLMPDSGYVSESKLAFDKVGKFLIDIDVRDEPKEDNNFDAYKLWSMPKSRHIIVHRRPIADFSLTIKPGTDGYIPVVSDSSYDLDHTSRTDKGIVARQWSWKDTTSSGWISGLPSVFAAKKSYVVQLQVQDLEGAWSTPVIKILDTGSVNLPPVVDADPRSAHSDENITVTVTADDLGENDFNHTNYYWSKYTSKPGGTWTTRTTKTFSTTLVTEGTWYLHMEAFDNSDQSFYTYHGPYTLVENLPPPPPSLEMNASLVPNPALSGDEIIFTVDTVGYADKIVIFVDQDIVEKDNRDSKYSYPLIYNVNGGVNQKTNILRYITCVKTEQTLTKDNVRRRPPYTFIVRAYRGEIYRETELKLDIRRNVLELLHPGVLTN